MPTAMAKPPLLCCMIAVSFRATAAERAVFTEMWIAPVPPHPPRLGAVDWQQWPHWIPPP